MKPLPSQVSAARETGGSAMPTLPTVLAPASGSYSTSNRRAATCPVQRVYPWMLFASTAIAALFCLMYITKPVIMAAPNTNPMTEHAEKALPSKFVAPSPNSDLLPDATRLPGETKPVPATPRLTSSQFPSANALEETNLRIQHILTAEAPGGNLARIDIEVPVLYQSRNLRWTASEVAAARALLLRLADYQEKSQLLRAEGFELLESWNRLVEHSIPSGELRADSPTLPINQLDAADTPRPAGLNTTESIQIQPAGK